MDGGANAILTDCTLNQNTGGSGGAVNNYGDLVINGTYFEANSGTTGEDIFNDGTLTCPPTYQACECNQMTSSECFGVGEDACLCYSCFQRCENYECRECTWS